MKFRPNSGRPQTPASARAASMQGRVALQAAIDNEAFAGIEDFCAADENEIIREYRLHSFGSKQEGRS